MGEHILLNDRYAGDDSYCHGMESTVDNRQEQLRARAYGIWQAEGEPHGRDREHWEMAERELAAPEAEVEATAPKSTTPRRKKAAPVQTTDKLDAKPKPRKPRATKPA